MKKNIIAYLYDKDNFSKLKKEELAKLDYINYSFGLIKDGIVYIKENNHLIEILKYKECGVKIVLSIGGWGADGFSDAVSTVQNRKKFINSIIELIKKYDFDGIDLDWEYPTVSFANISSSVNDTTNFTFLCKELRYELDKFFEKKVLSIAVPCNDRYYNYKDLNEFVDFVNIMSYDLNVSCNVAIHHTNLYSNEKIGCFSSGDNAFRKISKYIDSNKIVLGVAFYGRLGEFLDNNSKLGDKLKEPLIKGFSYQNIKMMLKNGANESWDDISCSSYIINNNQFISYDNCRSISEKGKYVHKNKLGGLMFWELGANDTYDLLESVYCALTKE